MSHPFVQGSCPSQSRETRTKGPDDVQIATPAVSPACRDSPAGPLGRSVRACLEPRACVAATDPALPDGRSDHRGGELPGVADGAAGTVRAADGKAEIPAAAALRRTGCSEHALVSVRR